MSKTNEDFTRVVARLREEHPEHAPIEFRGQVWRAPFHCLSCGEVIPAYQFAFARACGRCDVGKGPNRRVTRMCADGHITDSQGRPVAPLSDSGDDDWQKQMKGKFGGGANACRCHELPVVQMPPSIVVIRRSHRC